MSRKQFYNKVLTLATMIVNDEKRNFNNIVDCIEFTTKCIVHNIIIMDGELESAWILNLEHDLIDLQTS